MTFALSQNNINRHILLQFLRAQNSNSFISVCGDLLSIIGSFCLTSVQTLEKNQNELHLFSKNVKTLYSNTIKIPEYKVERFRQFTTYYCKLFKHLYSRSSCSCSNYFRFGNITYKTEIYHKIIMLCHSKTNLLRCPNKSEVDGRQQQCRLAFINTLSIKEFVKYR